MTTPSDNVMELLTAYALDALEPEEAGHVLQLLQEQPELRRTLAELRAAAGSLPYALPEAEPPPDLRQRTLDRAVGRVRPPVAPRVADASQRLRRWVVALAVVSVIALVAAGIAWQQLASARAEIASLRQQQQRLAETVAQSVALVKLQGANGHGTVVRSANGSLLVAAHLPPLQDNRVYQLWLIQGQGTPVSGGTFRVNAQGDVLVSLAPGTPMPNADTFAITNEPAGGSPAPTNPPLIVGSTQST
jgi:anti-sigma-K factor RskA